MVGGGKEGRVACWAWGGRREVVKATASARVNLPTSRSMRGTVHTCSAGSHKSMKEPCSGRIPQKDAETW